MGSLECMVKLHKPCWACEKRGSCDELNELKCVTHSKYMFQLRKFDTEYSESEYKRKFEELEAVRAAELVLISDLNDAIDHILSSRSQENVNLNISTKGMVDSYRILVSSLTELAGFGMYDSLTGLPNRRTLDRRLHMEWRRAARNKLPLSLCLVDIDHFKNYNDTHGHQQGDAALCALGSVLDSCARRPGDIAARWGGEEFAVVLAETDLKGAIIVAEKIRTTVESLTVASSGSTASNITVSIGVTTRVPYPNEDGLIADFIEEADKAMYDAKQLGRNRVRSYEQL